MSFAQPLILLALVPLCLVTYLLGRRRLRRLPPLRAVAILAIRLAIGALLVLALADPRATRVAQGVHVVYLIDRSASMGRLAGDVATRWLVASLRARPPDDSASVVAFGALPLWLGPLAGSRLPAVDGTGTNIEAALRLALAGLPPDQPSRLVLLSDGRQTSGDALQAAQQAARQGIPVSVIAAAPAVVDDTAVTSVDVPRYSRSGDHLTLRVELHASRPATVHLQISVDGRPAGIQTLRLPLGSSTFFFVQTAGAPGTHLYRVQVFGPPDGTPQNDALDAATVVSAAPSVLLVTGDPAAAGLAATLRQGGLRVQVSPAEQAPRSGAALEGYDAVVLADVAAAALPAGAAPALRAFVHEQGHGLLVTGGAHSFITGGYAGTPLESLLPLTSAAAAHTGRSQVGLVLLIDKSGSMMDAVQGVSKIGMAQQAAIEAVAHLQATDQYGVLAFDDTTHVVVPFAPVGDAGARARTRLQIQDLRPFGDTVIYPALQQAARWLFASHLPFKHVVLLTDGQGEDAPYLALIKRMHSYTITLSTIGIGGDAQVDELKSWATTGNGRFYFTADPRDIPRLVVQETRISSGPTRVQGTLAVRQASAAPALRSLAGRQLPSLGAYNIAVGRDGAQVLLQSGLGDPLLAQWQYGLGRVAAWTGGSSADWARDWLGQRTFWSDLLRGLMPTPEPRALQPDLSADGGMLRLGARALNTQGGFADLLNTRATVIRPDGSASTVDLPQDAPGHYAASIPATLPGIYRVRVAQFDGSAVLRQADGAVALPYSAEYAPATDGQDLLASIAAAGNAPTLRHPGEAFSGRGLVAKQAPRSVWPLFALLALVLFPMDVALRVLYRPPAPYTSVGGG